MPTRQINFYLVLNVPRRAGTQEIKRAWLKLAGLYHPDKNRGNRLAEQKFQRINEAWQVLKDPEKRQAFDQALEESEALQNGSRRGIFAGSAVPVSFWGTQANLSRSKEQGLARAKDLDLERPLKVSLEDLCHSSQKSLDYIRLVDGKKTASSFDFRIPLGARPGARLKFKGRGGGQGKIFGDLYVKIQLQAHKIFKIMEDYGDLLLEMPVSFVAAWGDESLKIPTPYGFLNLGAKPPLKHKQLFKIKGCGLPLSAGGKRGDFYVRIMIDGPIAGRAKIQEKMSRLSPEGRKIYSAKLMKSRLALCPQVLKFQKKIQELKAAWPPSVATPIKKEA